MIETIKTGIEGLDAILNGGIAFEDNIVIVVRGKRGVFKTTLGMQAMLGIQKCFETIHPQKSFPIRLYSLNKSDETLKKMLREMVVSREVEAIKKGKESNLRSYLSGIGGGYAAFEEDIRHLLLTFDPNTDRFLRGESDSQITIQDDLASKTNLFLKGYGNTYSTSDYLSPNLKVFADMMEDIENLSTNDSQRQACIVVDGLSRMTEEELERLPLEMLKQVLRQRSRISILIMNDRETVRNLDADIIIDMQRNFDTVHNYTYHELSIAKNVKGQFAFGWHNYKPMNGLLYVYPSIHKIMSQQNSVDNTFAQAINTNARYAQSFADRSVGSVPPMSLDQGAVPPDYPNRKLTDLEKKDSPSSEKEILFKLLTPHKMEKGRITSIIGNHNTFKRFLTSVTILNSILSGNEVFVLLLNERRKGMMDLIDKIRSDAGVSAEDAAEAYQRLFFWEVRMGCISPEELISFVLEYVQLRRTCCPRKRIEVFVVDLATIEQCFPMLSNETLFIPTLSTLCRERKVDLHLVCNKKFSRRSTVCAVSDMLICTQRENNKGEEKGEETRLTLYLEKNDFGPRFNSRVFKMNATNLFVPNYDASMRFNVSSGSGFVTFAVNTEEISTMKDYWRAKTNTWD